MASSERDGQVQDCGGPLPALGWVTAAAMAQSVVVMIATQFA